MIGLISRQPLGGLRLATLYLVRHGQASFGKKNYDQLSDIGEQQAAAAGASLAQWLRPTAVFSGDLSRQINTARPFLQALDMQGGEPLINASFDEYQSDGVFKAYMPVVLQNEPELKTILPMMFERPAAFKEFFDRVLSLWLNDADYPSKAENPVESWQAFTDRVITGITALCNEFEKESTLMAFTSGGPICVALGHALGLDAKQVIRQTWLTRNASVTHLQWSQSGVRMHGYNNVEHLRDNDALLTYR